MEESAAIHLIKKAVQFDSERKYGEALVCYTEGIELLLTTIKNIQDDKKKSVFKEKIRSYFERAEALKRIIEDLKQSGKYHEQIEIEDNSIGNSYEKLLSRFFNDETVTHVHIFDPYIRARHQIHNFLRFCDMLVKLSKNIKKIILVTGQDESSKQDQNTKLNEISNSLLERNIKLEIKYDQIIHDREIRVNNGWIIKIGRGLDYFKAPESKEKLCIGFHDMDLRPCFATTIDIFHENATNRVVHS